MKITSQTLKTYILEHAQEMTDQWLSLRNREEDYSIYSNHMPMERVEELRKSNRELIQYIASKIVNESVEELKNWGAITGEKRASLYTPINRSMEQFKVFRGIFLTYYEKSILSVSDQVPFSQAFEWCKTINNAFDEMIQQFTHSYFLYTNGRLKAQEEMIDELSTPVISITDGIAVLPLVGDIDTHRAKILMEHTLNESSQKDVDCLIIDLSGVLVVDTMVAQELFKVISALNLTGVEVSITGMRPELASSIVGLGIKFNNIKVYNNLEQALKDFGIKRH
ncbi:MULTISPECIES: STAS domain-containing protein [unclassified Bacillus (in: firmicutes)]|uniref:STAS domain-containing protein n=1 Tax=unclassified Bacillus (in: firmicutes) TaxID=185979 RepID=UPI0008E49822|nr:MULTISPECIES: STAS domain-containing protein [unclassified Bacillus (in: firmicutes)]SFA89169.1 rsbT co-antagonist protein RsbR [Bacillus sp. UNCCL13]SFQ84811.1 rsbT co-antagonist protein RsbR [Bacillus sp. cl95]